MMSIVYARVRVSSFYILYYSTREGLGRGL